MSNIQRNFIRREDKINTTTTATTSLTDIVEIDVEMSETLGCEIAVTTAALDMFAIQVKFTGAGSYQTLFSAAGDFTSPSGLLVGASGDLTTQAVGSGWFIMECDGISKVKIQAASGTTTSGVQALGSAK